MYIRKCGSFRKLGGTLFGGPYNKAPTISGTIVGSLIFGNSHVLDMHAPIHMHICICEHSCIREDPIVSACSPLALTPDYTLTSRPYYTLNLYRILN